MGILHSVRPRRRKSATQLSEYLISADISNGRESVHVPAISYKRHDQAPSDFHYVTECVQLEPVGVDISLLDIGCCQCVGDCRDETQPCACSLTSNSRQITYGSTGRLSAAYPVTAPEVHRECNAACACNPRACKNRVIQAGTKSSFALFRTKSRGWGVRTLEPLRRGTFVGVYTGELISAEASSKRADDTYLFNLARAQTLRQSAEQRDAQVKGHDESHHSLELKGEQLGSQVLERVEEFLEPVSVTTSSCDSGRSSASPEESVANHPREAELVEKEERRRSDQCNGEKSSSSVQEVTGGNLVGCSIDDYTNKPQSQQTGEEEEAEQIVETELEYSNVAEQFDTFDGHEEVHDEGQGAVDNVQQHFICDAKFFGNFTRFINHSCEPNVFGIRSFTLHQDERFPYIAFFTLRDLAANEELTLNYGDNYWIVKCQRDQMYCLCKQPGCRFNKKTFPQTLAEYNKSLQNTGNSC